MAPDAKVPDAKRSGQAGQARRWRDFRCAPTVGRKRERPPGVDGEAGTGEELNKIYTKFRFFRASPDGRRIQIEK